MPAFLGGGGGIATPTRPPVFPNARPMLAPTDVRATINRFRRHLNGLTTDATNTALGGCLVLVYDTATRVLVAALTSDANGSYDLPLYSEGLTYFIYTNKAGSPEVFGGSSNTLVPL